MKRLIWAMLACLVLTGCEVRMSDNGDFDGLWQMTAIDSVATGRTRDMHTFGEYWAVQVHLLNVHNTKGRHGSVLFRFDFVGDSLKLRSPYIDESGEGATLPAHNVSSLKAWGIDHSEQGYRVVTLNGDEMVLQKENVRLRFRKY